PGRRSPSGQLPGVLSYNSGLEFARTRLRASPETASFMHGTARGAACLEFGRFRLFTRQRELRLGDAPVPLGYRAFDVLLILVEAQGELVTKEELLARVWPGAVVEESNIQVQVSALRKALGEDRNLILTVPLRGYRFTGEVRTLDAEGRALGQQSH